MPLMVTSETRAEDCLISDAFKMGEVEEKDLDEVCHKTYNNMKSLIKSQVYKSV